ncbi:MAG TPA: TadE/TadG family type IV pilus assembly protein [Pelagibacterium sp.]|uniref:TadE/TadG family type IV pilus assembly protein n=1 Tax=Pelagibacterium sp. TaxID=1967288 RepID=UPI002C1A52E0|nr:TadE/TadG family type IV pilus assembly protein [Pelagibacterium sp.]HWJ88792.1 TadE/TadG family type IV pilus assembly protein [Pelagibacterium sp.]
MGTIARGERKTGHRRVRLIGRFLRADRGVTAVEFAVVGPLFFAMIGATIETALAFFAGYALDTAVIDSSRLIRTGQPDYISTASADNYRAALCGRLYGIFDCEQLRISVQGIETFRDFTTTFPLENDTGAWNFTQHYRGLRSGENIEGGKYVMIEAYYKWPTFFNIPGLNIAQTADGKRLLASAHVLRTEPF